MALDGDQMKKLKTEEEFEALPIAKKLVSWDPLDDECWLRLIKFVDGKCQGIDCRKSCV